MISLCSGQSKTGKPAVQGLDKFALPQGRESTHDWINFSSQYLKIGTAQDAIFRLTAADLLKYGVEYNSIDPRTIKIYESGMEIPLKVYGQNDGIFDNNDYIEFYGTKHYSKISPRIVNQDGAPYNNFLDKYTDTTYYFLTWGNGTGKRMQEQDNFSDQAGDTLNYYTYFSHVEENTMYQPGSAQVVRNQYPDWLETEAWYWGWLGVGTLNYSFTVTDLVPGKNAGVFFKALSWASNVYTNAHNLVLKVNSVTADSQSVNKNDRLMLGKIFNASVLKEGSNSFSVTNLDNKSNPNTLAYDWYEIEYPRKLKAVKDSLRFEIRDSVKTALRIIRIDNCLSDSLLLYRVMPSPKKINFYKYQSSSVYFTDTVGAGYAYIIISKNKVSSPKIYYKKQFADLLNPEKQGDYIAITHESLSSAAQDYLQFIRNNYKTSTQLIPVNDIFDQFSFGYPEPEAMKEFLKNASARWAAPKPVYLTLIGSATYDYKAYMLKIRGSLINRNLVPSYGEPVSDSWFAIWDSTYIPKLLVGRIPANTSAELYSYLEKHKAYLTQKYDIVNKSALFFSGGDGSNQSELNELKSVNTAIINESVSPRPLTLNTNHFYKTSNPFSDFGPFPYSFVESKIKEGALFISYIGHSGTRTWDNSIGEPDQLNNASGKSFLVTDFGCSTNKFAEPDIASFSSLFLFKGQAIAYIGNTSLGFTSTTVTVPQLFYHSIFRDSVFNIAKAHLNAKIEMFKKYGNTETNRIFALTNNLVGDPVINLAVPHIPDLRVENRGVHILNDKVTDRDDSVRVQLSYVNLGSAAADSFSILITDKFANNKVFEKRISRILPVFGDSLIVSVPVDKKTGIHNLTVSLDPDNRINELNEDDNTFEISYNVFSSSVRQYVFDDYFCIVGKKLRFLNPSAQPSADKSKIFIETDSAASFISPSLSVIGQNRFYTDFDLSKLPSGKRFYLRSKLDENASWDKPVSFIVDETSQYKIKIDGPDGFKKQEMNALEYNGALQLSMEKISLNIKSSGGDVAGYGSININGVNVLPNTKVWGMGIAVINENTMHVDTALTFWTGNNPPAAAELVSLINSIPNGKLVAMNAIDDAAAGLTPDLKKAIKTLGSTKVDSISWRGPWILLGKKGAAPGKVIEIVKTNTYPSILSVDSSFVVKNKQGRVVTGLMGPAGSWKKLNLAAGNSIKNGSMKVKLIGQKKDLSSDTLNVLKFDENNTADLGGIDAGIYPYLKVQGDLYLDDSLKSPLLSSISVDFKGTPELGLNYQTVSISKDTLQRGDMLDIDFSVFNAGEIRADSVRIKVEVVRGNNDREIIYNAVADSIPPDKSKDIQIKFNSSDSHGLRYLVFNVDPENKIKELFEDNNYYNIPFYISPDTTVPYVKTTFDGNDIINGDYVSVSPEIRVALSDDSFLPVSDTSAISLVLNNKPVWYRTTPELKINYSASNPKAVAIYKPQLANGEYRLKVTAKNTAGNFADIPDSIKIFVVSDQLKVLDLYNYPNPFRTDTYFTFKLPQIPEIMRIKIYTVAGRLIKNIEISGTELKYDFNKIYWDGRDQEGDLLANGTYFYKVTLEKDGKSESYIRKLAIIR